MQLCRCLGERKLYIKSTWIIKSLVYGINNESPINHLARSQYMCNTSHHNGHDTCSPLIKNMTIYMYIDEIGIVYLTNKIHH